MSFKTLSIEATKSPIKVELANLLQAFDEFAIDQSLLLIGDGIYRLGQIIELRAEDYFQQINYLLHPAKEPIVPIKELQQYVRQTMVVDLDGYCAPQKLPTTRKQYTFTECQSEEEVITQVTAAIAAAEAIIHHDEDISGWAAAIRSSMAKQSSMSILQMQKTSALPLVDIWLGVILGDDGYVFDRSGGDFYSIEEVSIEGLSLSPIKHLSESQPAGPA